MRVVWNASQLCCGLKQSQILEASFHSNFFLVNLRAWFHICKIRFIFTRLIFHSKLLQANVKITRWNFYKSFERHFGWSGLNFPLLSPKCHSPKCVQTPVVPRKLHKVWRRKISFTKIKNDRVTKTMKARGWIINSSWRRSFCQAPTNPSRKTFFHSECPRGCTKNASCFAFHLFFYRA